MKSPLITMSAITGKPTREEVFAYLRGLKDNGIDTAMVYPRSGCELNYLEDDWFEAVSHFVDASKELDMSLWIYDDFNWPSGDAHGRVSKVPEYRLRAICTKGEKCGEIDFYSKNKGSIFGETYFPNLLDEKAMDYFIECTHERYYKHFGQYFGTLIKGFYTDEPGVGYCCTNESMPYYEGMAEDYNKECGRDFFTDMKNAHEDFYAVSLMLIGKKYRKCFLRKLSDWCNKHNVALTGHLMEDTTPHGATKQCGDLLKALSCMDIPGIDELRTRLDDLCLYNLLGGVQYGRRNKKGAMAELFALGPCDISYANKRSIIFLCSCFGINNYFLATSHFDMRGNMYITDYFNLFTPDTPDFGGTRLLSEQAKIAALLAEKDFVPKVYIRYPTEICARHLHKELNLMRFFKLVNYLTYNQIQWKYLDEQDEANGTPVIEFTDELEYLVEGKKLTLDEVLEKFSTEPCVTNLDGKTNEGIFVRKFDDGTVVVLNLYAPEGFYLIDGKKVYLENKAVRVYNGNVEEYKQKEKHCVSPEFRVTYCNENMIRTMFVDEQKKAEIECLADMDVTFAVRGDVKATLSGNELECEIKESDRLTFGLRKLYNLSETVTLKKGVTVIESENDRKYLPSVFVMGDFACESHGAEICKTVIKPRKYTYKPGETLSDYGKVELTARLHVPSDAKAIELEVASLYTEVYINGAFAGERIYSPYVFQIDEKYKNETVELKIIQYSNIGPVFGDVDYYTENSKTTNWKTPAPSEAKYGCDRISFIVE